MAGADLERVVELLRSERMDEQFRLLGAGTLLAELRSAVSVVHSNGIVSRGSKSNQRLMFSIQSLAAPLCELLDTLLHTRVRAEQWHQVPAVLFRHRFSRSSTLRDLGLFLDRFRSLASYVQEASTYSSIYESSSYGPGLPAPPTPSRDALPVPATASMVGRSELLEKMVSVLLADRTRSDGLLVMPIVGGPGVGKTGLARALLHDDRVKCKFGVRLAVPVTRKFFLETTLMLLITPEIAAQVQYNHSPEGMAIRIGRLLTGGDPYLIVLDDVWSDKDGSWLEIGVLMRSLPWNGGVVVTTRTRDVAAKLAGTITEASCTNKPFYLQPLQPEFCSSFVDEWAAAYRGDWPGELFREAGTKIAGRCGGVPLLLHYARARFCVPQGRAFWQGFLGPGHAGASVPPGIFWRQVLECIEELPQDRFWQQFLGHSGELPDGNAVLESAAASYQHLPSDMRSCLLYCSMFPSGFDYDVEELSDLLAAQGYIPPVVTKAQQKGFLQQLLDECFYPLQEHEYVDKCVYRIHKVLHIFAQFMDRKTSSVVRADQATQLATRAASQNNLTSLRRASLIVDPLTASFPESLFECEELGALILVQEGAMCPPDQPRCEISEIPQEFLQSCARVQALSLGATKIRTLPTKFLQSYNMRYLNLSLTDIDNVPSSISRLMSLQTLILSYCDKLRKLHPNVTKLSELQKLDLEGCCNLVELPKDLIKMKKLEYLSVIECSSLTQLPRGMGQLKGLQMLLGYIASYTGGSSMSELQSLANLHRFSLQSLEKVLDPFDPRFARLNYKTNLESLSLQWNMDDYSNDAIPAYAVLESLQPHRRLKALEIVGYEGKNLPSWMIVTKPYLVSLVEIRLINLRSCEKVLPPLGLLPSLKIAEISGSETICSVKDNFYGHKGTFPSLEKLIFSYMHNLEIWEQEHRPGMFSRLSELAFIQCPKLRALHMELPSLEKLTLWMNNKMLYGLKGALRGVAKSLEHISISFSEELPASSECEGLQDLGKLTKLEICGCDELTCLPQGLQHLSSIRSLRIENCCKLETLPHWLENLPSLETVRLSGCPLLHHIPGGLQHRPGIIIYVEDCPNLLVQPFPGFRVQPLGNPVDTKGKEININYRL
ncbi:unnamed protein product [Urochloa decumbens]|uniref:NB-ARC domain-containing protein n=1 Tax=Urochloa decumbens TaxID=240449 RepID=A0ABC8VBH0_9POAL